MLERSWKWSSGQRGLATFDCRKKHFDKISQYVRPNPLSPTRRAITVAKNVKLLLVIWGLQWLDTNGNSMLNWFLHTECHFINTTNNYIQTLRTKTSDLKQGKRLFNKQDKILICWRQVTFIRNWISVTLSKSNFRI